MVFQLPGLPEFEARRLALEIAHGLADAEPAGGSRDIPALRVEVPASPLQDKSECASQVVAEIWRELRRAP